MELSKSSIRTSDLNLSDWSIIRRKRLVMLNSHLMVGCWLLVIIQGLLRFISGIRGVLRLSIERLSIVHILNILTSPRIVIRFIPRVVGMSCYSGMQRQASRRLQVPLRLEMRTGLHGTSRQGFLFKESLSPTWMALTSMLSIVLISNIARGA